MSRRRAPWWTGLLLLALAAGCSAGPAAAPAPARPVPQPVSGAPATALVADGVPAGRHLRVGYSALTTNLGLFWVGVEAGLFAREGLDVELVRFDGTARAMPALLSGEMPISMLASGAMATAAAQGADVVYFATSSNKLLFQVLTPPHITSPEQLRGQSLGVGGRGSASDFAMRYALRRLGYDPDQDVLIRDVPGGEMQIIAGLQSGSFLAGAVAPPTDYYGEQLGLRSLVRLGDWDVRYQGTAPGTTRAFLAAQRDTLRRFLRAYVASVHRAKTDRPYALAVLRQYTQIEDERALEWGYQSYIEPLDRVPYATEEGMQVVIDSLVDVLPDIGKLQPAALIDNSLLRELESEGFVAALYRS